MATVVCRLFNAVPADVAYFGAKDWQQTVVVRRMVEDLGLPIGISICPTIREPDGLALSSRNAYLSAAERQQAVGLHESLLVAEHLWRNQEPANSIEAAMRAAIEARQIRLDYAALVDPVSLEPLDAAGGPAVALVAGRLGSTRLIDNRLLGTRG